MLSIVENNGSFKFYNSLRISNEPLISTIDNIDLIKVSNFVCALKLAYLI